jgi:hypothetical protein
MLATFFEELGSRGAGTVLGFVVGAALSWLVARWRLMQQRRSILRGDARDTVVIQLNIVEPAEAAPGDGAGPRRGPGVLRIRSAGQGQLRNVVPNGHLSAELLRRAWRVTPGDALISMEGAEGSYLLETLTNFVCDRLANAPFDHDLYVMAPCCEPAGLAEHQPVIVLLISVADLALFEDWTACRGVRVEHGGDGARVLTLRELARRFRTEQEKIARLREAGQRTLFLETMYVLDLALDRRCASIQTKQVPWGRFGPVLQELNLD